jgi:hypothetical protein
MSITIGVAFFGYLGCLLGGFIFALCGIEYLNRERQCIGGALICVGGLLAIGGSGLCLLAPG